MAKKQGTSYSPNTALIQGAGVAYRNYDNAPGMYSGLDKVIEAGTGMMKEAVKGFETEQKRIEEEAKAAKAEKAKQDKDWFDLSGDVYANAGSFMKDVEYKDTAAKITALKKEYLAAQKSGSAEEMAAVQIKFNNIKSDIDDHKAFRETITDPEYGLSAAMDHSGVKDGSNGEDKAFMTGLIKEDYTITTEGGKKYYNVGGVKKTMAEIKEMAILKDNVPFATYHQTRKKYATAKSWNKEDAYFEVKNNIVPKTINGLKAFVADNGFGNGKNFTALLNDSKNKAAIKKEIDASLFDKGTMVKGKLVGANDGIISDAEYDQFVLAVTDSRHKTWKQADGSYDEQAWQEHTSKIVTEQLVNGMGNAWTANQPKTTNVNTGTGFLATANTKKPKGVMSGTLDRSFNYNISKNMYDQFKLSSEGKPAEFSIGSTNYKYDVENNNWVQTTGDGTKKDLGDLNATLGPKGFAIVDPDFLALRTAATEITESTDESFDIDSDNRLDQDVSTVMNNIDVKTMKLDDNVVAENIQKYLPLRGKSNPKGYQFLTSQDVAGWGLEPEGGDPFKESVTLYMMAKKGDKRSFIGPNGNRIKPVFMDGKPVTIQTGGDLEERRKAIEDLDRFLSSPTISKMLLKKPRA